MKSTGGWPTSDGRHEIGCPNTIFEMWAFVRKHESGSAQHTAGWYQAILRTVGGSELAAVMGWNPYRTFWEVVAEKAGVTAGWAGGSIECNWGTLFEDVMARFVEIDSGHFSAVQTPELFTGQVVPFLRGQ